MRSKPVWRRAAKDKLSEARAGWLIARDGNRLPTPLFQPVATAGSLRTLDWADLRGLGYRHVLMNTYHLVVRPGVEAIRRAGGVKGFTGWRGSVLTDSGGYQAFSLAARRTVRPDGLRFSDHIEGARHHFSPRSVLEAQLAFGVDFAMPLDICTGLPAAREQVLKDMTLTHQWAAEQALLWPELLGGAGVIPSNEGAWAQAPVPAQSGRQAGAPAATRKLLPPALFGIAQGGLEEDLRAESIGFLSGLPFDAMAVGGLAVGEPREDFLRLTAYCGKLMPQAKVRYLMGVGEPADLLYAIAMGFDLFDCVQPTRMARHGTAYTREGWLSLHNARYADDARPLDPRCKCGVCRTYSRAYLRHLLKLHEHSYARLLTLHNLHFYAELMARARRRIVAGKYGPWWQKQYPRLDRGLPDEL